MADETTQDKVKAITGGISDVVGAIGAAITGGKAQLKQEVLPSGQKVVKQDYAPYLIAGGAVIAAAGVLGFFLLRSRRVASNPGKKRRGGKRRGSRRRHLLPRLGGGGRAALLTEKLRRRGARSPRALMAWIGRQKYGKKRFQAWAAAGRKRARRRGRRGSIRRMPRRALRIAANRRHRRN